MKRYVEETGSNTVRDLLRAGGTAAARFSEAEIYSALSRRCREGAFSASERDRAIARLRADFENLLLVETTERVVAKAVSLVVRHPLRAADALQLGSSLELREQIGQSIDFVAFDSRLLAAARGEGLATLPRD